MTGLFSAQTDQSNANPLDALVGQGKKYATVEDLAKAQLAAQEHIQRLEDENGQFRTGIQETILNREQQLRTNTPPAQEPDPALNQRNVAPQEDLAERIREVTRQDREQEKARNNVQAVADRLINTFGDEEAADKAVVQRAKELDVPLDFLLDAASRSPAAFYAQMGLDAKPTQALAPRGGINANALHNKSAGAAKPGSYRYYQELRTTNKKLYDSPKIQLEMHKQAMENPEFYQ